MKRTFKVIALIAFVLLFFDKMQGQCFDCTNMNILIKDNLVIPDYYIRYKLFDFFQGDLAIVQDTESKKYGFINDRCDVVIPCLYLMAMDFSEGRAAVT